ncbi:MAG: ABC transporter ATP-binding protein [Myxococcales bacterium]|nr:ABC transporter ATP-binding protein [Myxococcales bacterium]MCB9709500.1 ABC transporter ATP-binding protein [Myxococcales bacterium]
MCLSGASYHFADFELEAIEAELRVGEILGVLGPNGSGKSTLVGLASGALLPMQGVVRINGRDTKEAERRWIAQQIAVVTAREELAFGFSVAEVVSMGRAPHLGLLGIERESDVLQIERVLYECDLWPLRERVVSSLSAGEQKRVSIARALAQQTPALVLDEPAAFLDIHHQIALLDLLSRRVKRDKLSALIVLHDLNLAAQYCDRVLLLRDGKQIALGSIENVMTYRQIRDAFDVEVYVGENELNHTRYFVPVRSGVRSD